MGFDLTGQKPKTDKGDYFRNNVWWWRRLWQFVVIHCNEILTDKDKEAGDFNNGELIGGTKAKKIAMRLRETLINGEADMFEATVTKMVNDAKKKNKRLKKNSKKFDWNEHYPFSVENLKEFTDFVEQSGGFRIS